MVCRMAWESEIPLEFHRWKKSKTFMEGVGNGKEVFDHRSGMELFENLVGFIKFSQDVKAPLTGGWVIEVFTYGSVSQLFLVPESRHIKLELKILLHTNVKFEYKFHTFTYRYGLFRKVATHLEIPQHTG